MQWRWAATRPWRVTASAAASPFRERVAGLVDKDSFKEVGTLTGQGKYDGATLTAVQPAPYVMGLANIDGRPVAVGGEDFTIRGGSSWSGDRKKGGQGGFVEDLAASYRIPLVNLIDGAGGSVTSINKRGHAVFPGVHGFERSVELLGKVPVVCAVLGTAAGGPAGRAILSHWSVMVDGISQVFAAGPPVVERFARAKAHQRGTRRAADRGRSRRHDRQPGRHRRELLRPDKALPVLTCRRTSGRCHPRWRAPIPWTAATRSCSRYVPRDRRRPYNMRKLIEHVVDRGSVFEIQPTYGKGLITVLARMNGKVVGVIANNPMVYGGAMDVKAARKQIHFVELCDCFHIPLVFLVDVPGFMVGRDAEAAATLREGMRAVYVGLQASVPMYDTWSSASATAWPGWARPTRTGSTSRLPGHRPNGVRCPSKAVSPPPSAATSPAPPIPRRREREIEDDLRSMASPFRTAEAFGVEEIIDPRETRPYLCRFIDAAQARLRTTLGPKAKYGVRP